MARTILGTHRFLGLVACNRCGHKWPERTPRAEIDGHLKDCQPDLLAWKQALAAAAKAKRLGRGRPAAARVRAGMARITRKDGER